MSDYRAFSSDDRRSASPSDDDDSKHIEPIFSRELFGEQLASWLDTLYAMERVHYAVDLPFKPHSGLFARPRGDSFYEANHLTNHFVRAPIELDYYLVKDIVPGARARMGWEEGLDADWLMGRICKELHARWAA